jgi:hypothetical protein
VVDLGQFIDDCRQIAQECTRDRSSRAVSDPTATPTCCGIQPGSSWPIRVWILGRCNTISATRTSSIRFDIANFLPNGFAISGRIREHLAARGSREAASVSPRSRASAFDESPIFSRPASIRSPERCATTGKHLPCGYRDEAGLAFCERVLARRHPKSSAVESRNLRKHNKRTPPPTTA